MDASVHAIVSADGLVVHAGSITCGCKAVHSVCDARSDAININAHAEVQKNEVSLMTVMRKSDSVAE